MCHGFCDHHRGLLPLRLQHGKDDRIDIRFGYGFWQRNVFLSQVTLDGGGSPRGLAEGVVDGEQVPFNLGRLRLVHRPRLPRSNHCSALEQIKNTLASL
jgi:hypothetical protein